MLSAVTAPVWVRRTARVTNAAADCPCESRTFGEKAGVTHHLDPKARVAQPIRAETSAKSELASKTEVAARGFV